MLAFFVWFEKAIAVLDPSGEISPLWPCEVGTNMFVTVGNCGKMVKMIQFDEDIL